jgi:putative Holliday junction resolvase
MRAIGLDLGERRIGVALCDSAGTLATPYETVTRSGDRGRDHRRIAELAAEAEAEVVVVGLPLRMDGSHGPAAANVEAEVAEMAATVGVPIETYDERLTTVSADRSLREMKLKGAARRRVVDQLAAAVILQGWLDRRRSSGP